MEVQNDFYRNEYLMCKEILRCQDLQIESNLYTGLVSTNGNFSDLAKIKYQQLQYQIKLVGELYKIKFGKEMEFQDIVNQYGAMVENVKNGQAQIEYPEDTMKR